MDAVVRHPLAIALLAPLALLPCRAAAVPSPVQSLITARCQGCHNDQVKSGGLSLMTMDAMRRGGKRGPALVPGKPESSVLYRLVSGGTPRMPLEGEPLTSAEVESIRKWIEQGAPWTESEKWWSLQPLHKPKPPQQDSGWGRTPIDAFISAKLREQGLQHSPEADRRTLIRRVTYDLHGLPPTAEEVRAFVSDTSPDAYEKLVDRLLASPRYGERWARHWLDAAHYGESHGFDKDKPRRNAWPYRDYVIRSFNDDKPYARFVREQLAGDVFSPDDPNAIVALGFIAAGPWDYVGQAELREGTTDKKLTRTLDRDDMVTVAMSTFTSMTVHCARCHDHKFDPISQADYYNLQSVFAGVDRADRPFDDDPNVFRRRRELMAKKRNLVIALRPLDDASTEISTPEIAELDRKVAEWKQISATDPAKRPPEITEKIRVAAIERKALVRAALPPSTVAEMDRLRTEISSVDAEINTLPKPHWVYAAASDFDPIGTFRFAPEPRPVHLLVRGNVDTPGPVSTPGALSCVPGLKARFDLGPSAPEGQRRAALANWIADPENMLTWRSIVNRVWHYHFGAGIVDSPNDFGHMGSLPTHPELLDWLAAEFRDNGGSFKKLNKLIVMSAVYRQASANNPANEKLDADNRFLWRANRQRLDAESMRDTILAVSGKLDLTMGGPSVEQFFFKDDHSPVYDYSRYDPDAPGNYRRSIYRFIVRSVPDPLMERFDCPDVSMITAKRTVTITAIQALALMNNPFVLKQAEHLAERVRQSGDGAAAQVRQAFLLTLQREPDPSETRTLTPYMRREGLNNLCRLLLNTNEFLFVD
ncbi:MAG TPA: PSD1 and planctomycete cytochrome C domain-containing protein [Bryobacteraceae bacterium]|nr:PSD1 and planctomycete cytochrome C domain-containing protein [Bryobacteraceae bacterium]